MNAPAEAFRCQSLAKEIAAQLRTKNMRTKNMRTKNIGAGDGIRTHDPTLARYDDVSDGCEFVPSYMVDRILHRTVGKTAPAQRSLARFGWGKTDRK
jgi:hypothetical protein